MKTNIGSPAFCAIVAEWRPIEPIAATTTMVARPCIATPVLSAFPRRVVIIGRLPESQRAVPLLLFPFRVHRDVRYIDNKSVYPGLEVNSARNHQRTESDCSMSVIKSSTHSRPTENLSKSTGHGLPSPSMLERCSTRLSTPPSDVARFQTRMRPALATAATSPSLTRIDNIPPNPPRIWRAAMAWPGCETSPG